MSVIIWRVCVCVCVHKREGACHAVAAPWAPSTRGAAFEQVFFMSVRRV